MSTQTQPTAMAREVDHLLQEAGQPPLQTYLAQRRARGLSWRRIAIEVTSLTGVDVSYEPLRQWHQRYEPRHQRLVT
jgi:hypothetical protein